jgi:Rrf2 family cysteine metabolism transcriptional repressor
MLSISSRGVYGLTAVVELGRRHGLGTVQIRDIARVHSIPQHYLEQILVTLKKARLVKSHRGAQGGYSLARGPGQIKVLEVLESVEGELEVVPLRKRDGVLAFFWSSLDMSLRNILNLSIEDLILDMQKSDSLVNYSI